MATDPDSGIGMSSFNKFVAWMGLVDETEHSGDQPRDSRSPGAGQRRPPHRPQVRPAGGRPTGAMGGRQLAEAAPTYRRPQTAVTPDLSVVVRPGEQAGSMVGYTETIDVRSFEDAKRIADLMRERIPVVVNLRDTDPTLVRRLVDFSSGLVYALDGSIRKVAEGVLLVSPPRVRILERELRRLAELGLYDLDA